MEAQDRYDFLPVNLWGLDPLYWSHVKLFIGQIKQLKPFPDLPDTFCLYNHPIARVEVVGYIVSVHTYDSKTRYAVDDGSGAINCNIWHNSTAADGGTSGLMMGKLARFWGSLKRFRNQLELSVQGYAAEHDLNTELLHWLEVVHLTSICYSKPSRIIGELLADTADKIANPLLDACVRFLQDNNLQMFRLSDLISNPELASIAKKQALKFKEQQPFASSSLSSSSSLLTPASSFSPSSTTTTTVTTTTTSTKIATAATTTTNTTPLSSLLPSPPQHASSIESSVEMEEEVQERAHKAKAREAREREDKEEKERDVFLLLSSVVDSMVKEGVAIKSTGGFFEVVQPEQHVIPCISDLYSSLRLHSAVATATAAPVKTETAVTATLTSITGRVRRKYKNITTEIIQQSVSMLLEQGKLLEVSPSCYQWLE